MKAVNNMNPPLDDRDGFIWMDGHFVPWREAKIHVLSHTLHYGCGVFEGIRAYETSLGTAVFRLKEHIQRLFDSAKILRISIPYSFDQIFSACLEVVQKNQLLSAYIRPLVWIGSEKLGVSPIGNSIHCMVASWTWNSYLGEKGLNEGVRIKTSSYARHHVNITLTQAKTVSNYTNSILANMEVTSDGYDEALLLDANGFVAEGAGENIFIIRKGKIFTPDLSSGALKGITRDTIFEIAKDLQLELIEKRITRDEIYIADEAFFTGTAAEVTPIRELDQRTIGHGKVGPITKHIQDGFFNIVKGHNARYHHWLSTVPQTVV
ncbi:MAG: branched-chain amino acid transaminase [Gammaproteobacteria bacterium]|nr:branched-chain amino acid transaminase [Gammaproteobacteria bacterium]